MTPSRLRARTVGIGDFHAVGETLARLVIELGGLQPHERVLDVGCGIGRLAVPLTRYLQTGAYEGFDVSRSAIAWCRRAIARRQANFGFRHVDVFSRHYNRAGTIQPESFRFPYDDETFDVAFLGSIVTHLTPPAAARYVAETARVLKRGGRAVMTFFLLDGEVRKNAASFDPPFTSFPEPWWAVQSPEDPEAAVAYDIAVVRGAFRDRSLEPTAISRGAWSGHAGAATYQDTVVARKI